jgi:hypothetical protein
MEAQVWTLIGMLGAALLTLIGAYFHLGSRIDSLGTRLDSLGARIDEQGRELRAAIEALRTDLSSHLERHTG